LSGGGGGGFFALDGGGGGGAFLPASCVDQLVVLEWPYADADVDVSE